jgi:hypothetical protein
MQILIIEGELVDLNTYIDTERSNRFQAAALKRAETERVAWDCRAQRLQPMARIEETLCAWYTRDERKDADNVAFALKFIYDGLVLAKVIPNDSRRYTGSILHRFYTDKQRPRVEVTLR